ncbi:MAG: hypothetical protein KKF44_06700 [Nanoarchaeota archaeon]|nr:hypothetical protein [Nanoarchaeota archaeon]
MKKTAGLVSFFFIFLSPGVFAFFPTGTTPFMENSAIVILGIETILMVLISANIFRFINITKKNPVVRYIYIVLGLFLFNSVLNLLYFISTKVGWLTDYMYVYLIERIVIIISFFVIMLGFLNFNKLLRNKA